MFRFKNLFFLTVLILFSACSKKNTNNSLVTDFSGKYEGSTTVKVSVNGQTGSQPYNMVLDISKGDNSNEIKILFGSWLTKATLGGNKFIIQETSFPGPITTTGNGEFSGNKLTISYTQKSGNIQTINYSGTLTKF